MVAIEDLQKLWQSQPVALAEPAASTRASDLTAAFRRYGRRQNYFNVFRLSVVILQVVLWIRGKEPRTALTLCGIALLLGELVFLFSDWRNQFGIARLNFTEPSLAFVRNTIQRLYDQRNPFRQQAWFLGLTVGVGLNLLVLAKDQQLAPLERIGYHLSACAAPFAMFVLGLNIRGRRWRYECLPLVGRLRAIERALEESEI